MAEKQEFLIAFSLTYCIQESRVGAGKGVGGGGG